MSDIVSGLYGGGTSGSLGAGKGNNKTKNTYIGERAGQAPLEDIMGLLASEANQQRAQKNMIDFGAGHGGSFESADQRAARAAGGHLNQKPYGGWGGYGSENPVLVGHATGQPPITPGNEPPTDGDLPIGDPDPPTGGDLPIRDPDPPVVDFPEMPVDPRNPGGGTGGTGTVPAPPRGGTGPVGSPGGGGGDEWAAPAAGGDGTMMGSGSFGGGGGGLTPGPEAAMSREAAGTGGTNTNTQGGTSYNASNSATGFADPRNAEWLAAAMAQPSQWDDTRGGDAFYRSEMKRQDIENAVTAEYGKKAQAAMLADPQIKAFYAGMKKLGYSEHQVPNVHEVYSMFKETEFKPEDLLKHYGLLIQSRGGDGNRVASAGHGAEFRSLAEGLADRLRQGLYGTPAWSTDESAANPIPPSGRPPSQFANVPFTPLENAGVPVTGISQTYDAQQAKWDRTFGKAKKEAAAKAAAARAGGPPARATADNPMGLGAAPGEGEGGYASAMTSVIEGAPGEDTQTRTGTGTGGTRTQVTGTEGQGTRVPVTGTGGGGGGATGTGDEQDPSPMWKRIFGLLKLKFPDTDPEELYAKWHDFIIEGETNGWDDAWKANPLAAELKELANPTTPEVDEDVARPSQFGPQGFNPTMKENPITGQMEPINPATMTGDGGYAVGDAWSTSPEWRPEEPTGGLYGAYTELASGNMTDYENGILEGWKGRAVNPSNWLDEDVNSVYKDFASGDMTDYETRAIEGWQGRSINPMGWADDKTLASIDTYEKTPGRGEDEAYGAYNDMLQGGYSDAEQNAIAQEGMRAARAGYESNRDAMLRNQARTGNSAGYAANMGKMARGFSETMGSQGRQNQIDFANEAQRRKETGAGGMLNVAGLANQRGSTSIAARQGFGNELARRQETAIEGMERSSAANRGYQMAGAQGLGDQSKEMARRQETALGGQQQAAGYGRDLQQKGLQGLQTMSAAQDPTKQWATAAGIGSAPRETYNETGSASL